MKIKKDVMGLGGKYSRMHIFRGLLKNIDNKMKNTLLNKLGEKAIWGINNSWKILPLGSLINYDRKVDLNKEKRSILKAFAHSAYLALGLAYIAVALGFRTLNPIEKINNGLHEDRQRRQIEQQYNKDYQTIFGGNLNLANSNLDDEVTNQELGGVYDEMGIPYELVVEPSRKPTQDELTKYIDAHDIEWFKKWNQKMSEGVAE